MEIQLQNGDVLETDKLSDEHAEVFEATNKLYAVCKKYNYSLLTRVYLGKDRFAGAQRIKSTEDPEDKFENVMQIIMSIDQWLQKNTDKKVQVSFDNLMDDE
jgi:hypothetical protein